MKPALNNGKCTLSDIAKLTGTVSLALSITACNVDESVKNHGKPKTIYASKLTGVWEQKGYGQIVDFNENTVSVYQYDRMNCFKLDEITLSQADDILGKVSLSGDKKSFRTIPQNIPSDIHPYIRIKLNKLPQRCEDDTPNPDTNYQANYEVFWHTFYDYYAFFDARGIDWTKTDARSREKLKDIDSSQALFSLFKEMLSPINDGHINLVNDDELFSPAKDPLWLQRLQTYFDDHHPKNTLQKEFEAQNKYQDFYTFYNARLNRFLKDLDRQNVDNLMTYLDDLNCLANDNICYGVLDQSRSTRKVGYLLVDDMAEYSANPDADYDANHQILKAAMDEAMGALYTTDALIIDVRRNQGGYDSNSLEIAGRFTQKGLHAFSKKARHRSGYTDTQHITLKPTGALHYSKPVYLLIGGSTYSGAETFSLTMRNLPQVTLIGESTGGILSDTLGFELPNGWDYSLSNEVYTSPKGENFESIGIPPAHKVVYMWPDDVNAGKDTGIEKALSLVK